MELFLVKREVETYSQWYHRAIEWPKVVVQVIQSTFNLTAIQIDKRNR